MIGVMSDTHDNRALVDKALRVFGERGVDTIIHLGDLVAPFTLRRIAGWARERGLQLYAVYGNNCGEKLGLLRAAESYGYTIGEPPVTLELGDRRVLLVHGFGSKENTLEIVNALAVSNRWDAVLYGHTHEADVRRVNGTLVLNPGDGGGSLARPSVAILDLDRLEAEIIWLDQA